MAARWAPALPVGSRLGGIPPARRRLPLLPLIGPGLGAAPYRRGHRHHTAATFCRMLVLPPSLHANARSLSSIMWTSLTGHSSRRRFRPPAPPWQPSTSPAQCDALYHLAALSLCHPRVAHVTAFRVGQASRPGEIDRLLQWRTRTRPLTGLDNSHDGSNC